MKLKSFRSGLLTLTLMLAPAMVSADAPGRHPAYLHARTDLRTAQFLLRVHDEPNVMRNLHAADNEIEAADLVTEMMPVKHHFTAGVKAQEGIEF